MFYLKIAKKCMIIGGVIEIAIGVLHFIWPPWLIKQGEYAGLSKPYCQLFLLAALAVGLCLVVFGILSLICSYHLEKRNSLAWIFGISQGVLWLVRMLFEIALPVRLPIFIISEPTYLILPTVFLLSLIYIIPLVLSRKEMAAH